MRTFDTTCTLEEEKEKARLTAKIMFLSGSASVGISAWKADDRSDQLQIRDSRFEDLLMHPACISSTSSVRFMTVACISSSCRIAGYLFCSRFIHSFILPMEMGKIEFDQRCRNSETPRQISRQGMSGGIIRRIHVSKDKNPTRRRHTVCGFWPPSDRLSASIICR